MRIKGATVRPVHQKGPRPARPEHAKGARRPDAKVADKGRPIRKKNEDEKRQIPAFNPYLERLVRDIRNMERKFCIQGDAREALRSAVEARLIELFMVSSQLAGHCGRVTLMHKDFRALHGINQLQGICESPEATAALFECDDLEAAFAALVFDSDADEDSDDKGASEAADAPTTVQTGDDLESAFAALVFDSGFSREDRLSSHTPRN